MLLRTQRDGRDHRPPPSTRQASLAAGYTVHLGERVALGLGLRADLPFLADGFFAVRDVELSLGSVQSVGFRQVPLLGVRLNERWSIDGYATLGFDVREKAFRQTYKAGATVSF